MAVSPYCVTPARIGTSSGLRLPAAFYRDTIPSAPVLPVLYTEAMAADDSAPLVCHGWEIAFQVCRLRRILERPPGHAQLRDRPSDRPRCLVG
jgi:hypothetical protein